MGLAKLFTRFRRGQAETKAVTTEPAIICNQEEHSPAESNSMESIARKWEEGIAPDLAFWDAWLASSGQPWQEDFQYRCQPDALLEERIVRVLSPNSGYVVQVLDVGAGPLTALGKQWIGHRLQITAINPLAEAYEALLQKHRLTPLVRTQLGFAERLVEQFGPEQFDLVHARNCIDHGQDPCYAIQQMVAVAKPGGIVYLFHGVNEAQVQQYHGFHQWNLFCKDGDLYVSNLQQEINMSKLLQPIADVECVIVHEHNWMVNVIRKR